MLEKLKLVEARYLEMAERAAQPDFYNDPKAASQRQLEPIITAYRSYRSTQAEQEDLRAMLSERLEPEMKALCQEEFSENKKKLEALEQELKILLLPRDPNDDKSVIMEIRGGVGGEESALFAHSLYRMYTMYAEAKHWTVTLLNYNETELGGVKEADFEIQGAGAYSRLKFESGVHRVQRVPETESGGRVHTSTATVAVLPEMEQAEVDKLSARQRVSFTYLNLPAMEEDAAAETEKVLETLVRSRPRREVYDADDNYLPAVTDEAYKTAITNVLKNADSYRTAAELTVTLDYVDGRWLINADSALLSALMGGAA